MWEIRPESDCFCRNKTSLVENNQAQQGGILYSQLPYFLVYQSVLKNNQTLNNNATNIYTAGQVDNPADIQSINAEVLSSTLLKIREH